MLPTRAPAPHIPDFTPVPRRPRSDGWTEARQRAFIAALAATGSATIAADTVGLCVSGAYALRRGPSAASFVRAWDEALDAGVAALKSVAFDRAVNGVPVTLFYHGEPAATTTRHDNRMLMSLLRHYDRPGTPEAKRGGAHGPSTDTATIMWLNGIRELARQQFIQSAYALMLEQLLKLRKFPDTLEDLIYGATYNALHANILLDKLLREANAGPEGMRAAAAGVTHKLEPMILSAAERERADIAMAYLRGDGPPLSLARRRMPEGAPDIDFDKRGL